MTKGKQITIISDSDIDMNNESGLTNQERQKQATGMSEVDKKLEQRKKAM